MGRCQGGFCGPRVQEIIARELKKDLKDVQAMRYYEVEHIRTILGCEIYRNSFMGRTVEYCIRKDGLTYHDKDIRMAVKIWLPDADDNGDSPTCTYPLQTMRDALGGRGFEGDDLTSPRDGGFYWRYGRGRHL